MEDEQQQQQQYIQKSFSSSGNVDSSSLARASPASNLVGSIGPQQGIHLLVPTDKDVLGGRGKVVQNHVGNVRFRELVGVALDAYRHAERYPGKAAIVQAVIETVHATGGRFLAHRRDRWIALTPDEQRDKVGHAVRDAAAKVVTTTGQQSSQSSSQGKLGTGSSSGKKSTKVSSAAGSSSPGGGEGGEWSLESCFSQTFDGKTASSSLPPYIDDLRRRLLRLEGRNRIHGDIDGDDDEPQRQPPIRTDDSGPLRPLMTKRRHAITAASDTVLSVSASSSAEPMRQSPVAAVAVSSSDYGGSIGTTTTSSFASMPGGPSSNTSSRRAGRHDHDGPALRHHSLIIDPPGVRKREFLFDRVAIIAGLARRHGSDGALLPLRRGKILSTTTAADVDGDDDPRQRRRQRQIRRSSSATQSSVDSIASFSSILQDTSEVFPNPSSSITGNGGTKTLAPGHQAADGSLRPSSEYQHHLHLLRASNNDSQRSGMSAMQRSIGTFDSIGDLDHSSMSFDFSVLPTTTASTAFHLDDHQSGISSDFRYTHPQPPPLQSGISSEFRYTHPQLQLPQLQQRLPQADEYLHHPLLRQSQAAWDQAVFQEHMESQQRLQALQKPSPKRMMMTHPQTIDQQPQQQQHARSKFGDTHQVHPTPLPPHFPSFPHQQQQQQLAQRQQQQQQQLELQRRHHIQLLHQQQHQQQQLLLQHENQNHHHQTVDTIPHPYSNLFEPDTDDDDEDNDLSMLPAAPPPPSSRNNNNRGQQR